MFVEVTSILNRVKIIESLHSNKAYGHDNITIRILKICGSSINKPLEMMFKQCIETGVFLSEWQNANIISIHKKSGQRNAGKLLSSDVVTYLLKKPWKFNV